MTPDQKEAVALALIDLVKRRAAGEDTGAAILALTDDPESFLPEEGGEEEDGETEEDDLVEAREGLVKKTITDINGVQRTVYVRPQQAGKADRRKKDTAPTPEEVHDAIEKVKTGGAAPDEVKHVAELLLRMPVKEIAAVKKALGLRAGGHKSELAWKVAEQATARITEREHWKRESRKVGIPVRQFFQAHAEIRRISAQVVLGVQQMLKEARKLHATTNGGAALTRAHKAFRGGDLASIKGFDATARTLAGRYPELLGAHGYEAGNDSQAAAEKLYDYLLAGTPKMPSRETTYQETLDYLASTGAGERRPRKSPDFDDEEIPF